jgi:uncharacterized protein YcgI (DUF1989 family)
MQPTATPQPIQDEIIPPGGRFSAEVAAGQLVRITDVEGGQVPDFISLVRADPAERLSMFMSRAVNLSWKFTTGHTLYSTKANPLWTIEADSLGDHYCGGGLCSARLNFVRYGIADTPSCEANLTAALARWGLGPDAFGSDTVFNIFMNVAYDPDGRWEIREPKGRPGDSIDLRALADQLVAISNCPQLLNACNGGRLKPLRLQLFAAEG